MLRGTSMLSIPSRMSETLLMVILNALRHGSLIHLHCCVGILLLSSATNGFDGSMSWLILDRRRRGTLSD